jgi:hypothetical protein
MAISMAGVAFALVQIFHIQTQNKSRFSGRGTAREAAKSKRGGG